MRQIAVVLGLVVVVVLGCDALEPQWGERWWIGPNDPFAAASCDDLCAEEGKLCLENSCGPWPGGGATLAIYDDLLTTDSRSYGQLSCELELVPSFAVEHTGVVSCCCSAGAQ